MLKKIVAVIITLCIAFSMIATVSAEVQTASPITVDFTTKANFEKSGTFLVDKDDTLHIAFDQKIQGANAAQFLHATYSGPFQGPKISYSNFYSVFDLKKSQAQFAASPSHSYAVIVYMTEDTDAHEIKLFHGNRTRSSVTLVEDASVSGGRLVRSEAIDISKEPVYTERLLKGLSVRLEYESYDKNSNFYVKELAFFTSKEEADAYYKDVYPVCGKGTTEKDSFVKFDFSGPDAMKYSKVATVVDEGDVFHGEFVPENGGSLKFNYGVYNGSYQGPKTKLSKYYASFVNQSEGFFRVKQNLQYMVIVFRTNDTEAKPITVWNTAKWVGNEIVKDASSSKGEFIRSKAVDISGNDIYTRISNETKVMPFCISYGSNKENVDFAIKEITFFASEEAANRYYGTQYAVEGDNMRFIGTQQRNAAEGTSDLRFLSVIDTAKGYQKLGYKITAEVENGAIRNFEPMGTVVYKSVVGYVDENSIQYQAADFGGEYFYCVTIQGIPADANITFKITPVTVNADGATVEYTSYTVVCSNGTVA